MVIPLSKETIVDLKNALMKSDSVDETFDILKEYEVIPESQHIEELENEINATSLSTTLPKYIFQPQEDCGRLY